MKTFVIIPPAKFSGTLRPLVAVDDAQYASQSPIIEHYGAYCYRYEDTWSVETMGVGQTYTDGDGWVWTRIS